MKWLTTRKRDITVFIHKLIDFMSESETVDLTDRQMYYISSFWQNTAYEYIYICIYIYICCIMSEWTDVIHLSISRSTVSDSDTKSISLWIKTVISLFQVVNHFIWETRAYPANWKPNNFTPYKNLGSKCDLRQSRSLQTTIFSDRSRTVYHLFTRVNSGTTFVTVSARWDVYPNDFWRERKSWVDMNVNTHIEPPSQEKSQ